MVLLRELPGIKGNSDLISYCDRLSTEHDIRTVEDLMWRQDLGSVSHSLSLSLEILLKWRDSAYEMYAQLPETALSVVKNGVTKKISTGCQKLDTLLGNQVGQGNVVEITGDESVGKTHMCHHLAIEYATKGYKVLYIDTEATFCSEKLVVMLRDRKIKDGVRKILSNILTIKLFDVFDLFELFEQVIQDDDGQFKNLQLIVIDSISGLLNVRAVQAQDAFNRRELFEIVSNIANYFYQISKEKPNLNIWVTRQPSTFLNRIWKNCFTHALKIQRTYLKDQRDEIRELELVRSLYYTSDKEERTLLTICTGGYKDYVLPVQVEAALPVHSKFVEQPIKLIEQANKSKDQPVAHRTEVEISLPIIAPIETCNASVSRVSSSPSVPVPLSQNVLQAM